MIAIMSAVKNMLKNIIGIIINGSKMIDVLLIIIMLRNLIIGKHRIEVIMEAIVAIKIPSIKNILIVSFFVQPIALKIPIFFSDIQYL